MFEDIKKKKKTNQNSTLLQCNSGVSRKTNYEGQTKVVLFFLAILLFPRLSLQQDQTYAILGDDVVAYSRVVKEYQGGEFF